MIGDMTVWELWPVWVQISTSGKTKMFLPGVEGKRPPGTIDCAA